MAKKGASYEQQSVIVEITDFYGRGEPQWKLTQETRPLYSESAYGRITWKEYGSCSGVSAVESLPTTAVVVYDLVNGPREEVDLSLFPSIKAELALMVGKQMPFGIFPGVEQVEAVKIFTAIKDRLAVHKATADAKHRIETWYDNADVDHNDIHGPGGFHGD